jgi:glycosyltransferase involved in cell wall biosynthesis
VLLLRRPLARGSASRSIEAQACGVPVIASDFSAQTELVGAGWLVKGQLQRTAIGAWQFRPDVEDIVDALQARVRDAARVAAGEGQGFRVEVRRRAW